MKKLNFWNHPDTPLIDQIIKNTYANQSKFNHLRQYIDSTSGIFNKGFCIEASRYIVAESYNLGFHALRVINDKSTFHMYNILPTCEEELRRPFEGNPYILDLTAGQFLRTTELQLTYAKALGQNFVYHRRNDLNTIISSLPIINFEKEHIAQIYNNPRQRICDLINTDIE